MRRLVLSWLGLTLLFFSLGHSNIENLDATATMHAARGIWLRGDSGLRTFEQGADSLGEGMLAHEVRRRAAVGEAWYGKEGQNGRIYVWFPIGHVWLMLPPVALGEWLDDVFPNVEQTFRDRVAPGVKDANLASSLSYRDGHFVWIQALAALWPAIFGAASVLLLLRIALALGAARRDAILATLAIALTTQFFPLTRENFSDVPGLCFLLGALLATVHALRGTASTRTMLLGGLAAGAAVLTRYPHAVLVLVCMAAIAHACWRRGSWRGLLVFALGGLPAFLLLLLTNWLRYGDLTETGYPKADSWFNYPLWFGATKILFAAGKGILWFSPLLWLAVPLAIARRRQVELGGFAWLLLALPLLLFSATNGWQSGQCWGIRYVTPGVVALLAIALPQLRPWQSWPKAFWLLFACGIFVNVTGVITPTRGHNQLAGQAVHAMYQREFQAGQISKLDWENLDEADHFFFLPRFSGLHANWTYAWRSFGGKFENAREQPINGSENTIEPLFGIPAVTQFHVWAPQYWEDRDGRHLWWVFWGALYGISPWLLLLPVLGGGALLLWLGQRQPAG
ncbi:MAG: glycosyltransferase family 39 protein [bacterium]|nr:glycosyltransferase family 39 protein [bacterium]